MTDKWLYRAATCKHVSPACGWKQTLSSQQLQNNKDANLKPDRQLYAEGVLTSTVSQSQESLRCFCAYKTRCPLPTSTLEKPMRVIMEPD